MDVTQPAQQDIHDIIDSGRMRQKDNGPVRPVLVLSGLSLLLLWLSFTPVGLAPAAWIALVPLCLLLRAPRLSVGQYLTVSGCAWIWAAITLQWMRLGHWSMYFALLALSFYVSLYIPVFVSVSRRIIACGFPLWLVVPMVWTALEFLRAWLITGFPWYYLGHSQYQWIELIQIADVTGVAGITFLVAMSSAAIAQCLPASLLERIGLKETADVESRQRWTGVVVCVVLLTAAVFYGWQRQQPSSATDGPVIALVQGHFPPDVKHDRDRFRQMVHSHDMLTARAAQEQPDLIVWPETMWPYPDWIVDPDVSDSQLVAIVSEGHELAADMPDRIIRQWREGNTREALINRSQEFGTSILFGLTTYTAMPEGLRHYNSAAFVRPDLGYLGRYDKIHRVIFGEYVPLKSVFPFLTSLTPYAGSGIEAGTQPRIFESGGYRYAPLICFEDTIPRLVRRIVNSKTPQQEQPDVLVNLTNDGWFHGSSELDQHLITALFRCVETRRPMVRAVNGGVSALIDSSGRIREPEQFLIMKSTSGLDGEFEPVDSMTDPETGHWYRQCSAVLTGQIPIDGRDTIYLRFGDWLAMLCFAVSIALWLRSFVRRRQASEEE